MEGPRDSAAAELKEHVAAAAAAAFKGSIAAAAATAADDALEFILMCIGPLTNGDAPGIEMADIMLPYQKSKH